MRARKVSGAFGKRDPGAIDTLSLLLILVLLRGFFSRFSGFPSSTKLTSPNSNSTQIEDLHEPTTAAVASSLTIGFFFLLFCNLLKQLCCSVLSQLFCTIDQRTTIYEVSYVFIRSSEKQY